MQIVIAIVFDGLGRMLVHERAKEPHAGSIDYICGGIRSGETPEQAAVREALEETSVTPQNLRLIHHGINEYNRYRFLFVGEAGSETPIAAPGESQRVGYMHPEALHAGRESGELTFVDGFFKDVERVLA